ncbi:hypothetical protein OX283_009620 [Flavobacterium sp. SUN052]|uniref:hypothetical protein n=1 Tax=Flavobacterium sp. SUN052 TaxID=3002441 RepID=UPI00237EBEDA|nr:hypothetical protein [Flavobacterium sp. SUN052]MEC4004913.1 hypothetical protein [Flavobacterium sp. SUN052]
MITKEKAIEIAKIYLKKNNWNYIYINEEKVELEEKLEMYSGKYEDKKRDVFTVGFRIEGYMNPILYIIYIDAKTSEVLYVLGPHGKIEILE